MSKHLNDLRMYKCILVLRSAVRATLTGYSFESLSGVPDYFGRNKILSGYDLSHYQVPHCIKSFLLFCLICVYSSQFLILFWIMYLL